ncbi:MAG TPA: 50S ribosomal protein L29 [Candidatus Polarisedimenticolaceae bacterium]|nr:50S ribosomal protein L29 [Candidatus Polarisedimenticolaceae bacterium]
MSIEDLDKEARQLREAIWKLRLQLTTGQLQDPQKVTMARKELARVLTVRREQEISAGGRTRRRRSGR